MARKWWTLVAVCVATFMLLLDITVVNVALPDIQKDLNASLSSLQWVVDAYSLTLAAFLLTAGSFADRIGRRRSLHRRLRDLHLRLLPLRHLRERDAPQPGPRAPGGRRGRDVRDLARSDRAGVPGPGARHGDRRLGGDDRRRRRRRPAGRRRLDRGIRLGVDLLRQRADRNRRHLPHDHQARQPEGAGSEAARLARPGDLLAWPVRAHLRADPRQPRGLVEPPDRRHAERRRRSCSSRSWSSSTGETARCSTSRCSEARLRRCVGGRVGALRLDVRDVPVPDAVHTGRARIRAARGGRAGSCR